MTATQTTQNEFRGHIAELDGLRAVGMAVVLLNHFWLKKMNVVLFELGQLGWIAMDSFFVLSGFLIAGILLDNRSKPDYYRTYYIRRALRIFPLYYLVLLILAGIIHFRDGGSEYRYLIQHWGSPAWFTFYLGNIKTAIRGDWAPVIGYAPLWSLQVEEQFYLLFPFAVSLLSLTNLRRLLFAAVAVSPILRILFYLHNPHNPYLQFVLLPCRLDGLAWGGLIAIRYRMGPWHIPKVRLTLLAIGLLAATCIGSILSEVANQPQSTSPYNRLFGYTLSVSACGCLVLWLIRFRGSPYTRWLRIKPVQYLGKISYGIYLLHLLAYRTLRVFAERGIGHLSDDSHIHFVLVVGLSVLYGALSWHFIERPIFRLKDRLWPSNSSDRQAASDVMAKPNAQLVIE
jgi:peptidoglycan/LPS O-acetylase OafA/YrhL